MRSPHLRGTRRRLPARRGTTFSTRGNFDRAVAKLGELVLPPREAFSRCRQRLAYGIHGRAESERVAYSTAVEESGSRRLEQWGAPGGPDEALRNDHTRLRWSSSAWGSPPRPDVAGIFLQKTGSVDLLLELAQHLRFVEFTRWWIAWSNPKGLMSHSRTAISRRSRTTRFCRTATRRPLSHRTAEWNGCACRGWIPRASSVRYWIVMPVGFVLPRRASRFPLLADTSPELW